MYHQAHEEVTFTAQYPVTLWGARYAEGEILTVGLVRDWDEDEGLGEGGPWGYGGYPSRLIAELSGDTGEGGHTHTCLRCGRELGYGQFDCEVDADHTLTLCDVCVEGGTACSNHGKYAGTCSEFTCAECGGALCQETGRSVNYRLAERQILMKEIFVCARCARLFSYEKL